MLMESIKKLGVTYSQIQKELKNKTEHWKLIKEQIKMKKERKLLFWTPTMYTIRNTFNFKKQ